MSPLLIGGLAAAAVVSGLLSPAVAWLQRDLLDALVPLGATHGHPALAGGLLALVLALGAAGVVSDALAQAQHYVQGNLRRRAAEVIFDRTYAAASSWPGIARFESPDFADKLQLSGQLAQSAASSLVTSALGIGQAVITAVTFMITLVLINPLLAAGIAVVQLLGIWASLSIARRQARLRLANSFRTRRQLSFISLLGNAMAAKEVRLFGLGAFLRRRLLADLRLNNDSERVLDRRELGVTSVLSALSAAVMAGGLIWTVAMVAAGHMPVGNVTLFALAASGLRSAMYQIAAAAASVAQSVMLFEAYDDVVSAPPDLPVSRPAHQVPALRHGVTVDDVWFRYDQAHPPVLRGVNMFIPAGAAVGLVGRNGSGKSTLVKLLCRLYDPERGRILWDGVDIRQLDPAGLRQRITGVFQDYVSYELTAADSIGMGDLGAIGDREAIQRAAALAGVDEDISRLPQGYDTMLSRVFFGQAHRGNPQAGVLLSGGQQQRVALARALMRSDRDLLIVDEPMSSLDAEAEHAVNMMLAEVEAGRTRVLISHRLASVRSATQIFVLDGGVVAERGTHAELLAAGGQYAHLFGLQASGYGMTPEPAR
jgi:ATP-binding cassette subfamily B protein